MSNFQVGETVRTNERAYGYEDYTFLGDVVCPPENFKGLEGPDGPYEVFVRCDYTDYRPDYSIGEVLGFYEDELEYIG